MSCSFSIPFTANPQEALEKAKAAVTSQGGNFEGDENAGAFSLSVFGNFIAGSYRVVNSELMVEITEKPFFVPCNTIESYLKGKISG